MERPAVLHLLQPPDGGVAAYVATLAPALAERGWTADVAASPENVIRPAIEGAGLRFHAVAMKRDPALADVAAARALRALDRANRYAVIHAHSSKAGALARMALPRARRIVYQPHCLGFAAGFGRGQRLLYRGIEQALVPRTRALVAVCEWERRLASTLVGGASRATVVRSAVAPVAQVAPHPAVAAFAAGAPLAGTICVMRPQKDPLALVDVAQELARRGAPGRVAIVGNGALEREVRAAIADRGLADRARWFPFEGDVAPYLAALDVFVLPSRWEALPLSVLEAMSVGLPVVATAVGGVPELVGPGTGRLVAPAAIGAMTDEVAGLLADPDARAALGTAARERVIREHRIDTLADAMCALYARVAA